MIASGRWGATKWLAHFAIAVGLIWPIVTISPAMAEPQAKAAVPSGYYIEFRARDDGHYGHAYIVYGDGAVRHRVGFFPGDNYVVGWFVPIKATMGESPNDDKYPPYAKYRRPLTAGQYRSLHAKVQELKRTRTHWHLVRYNCTNFVMEIADHLKMKYLSNLVVPKEWVEALPKLNKN